MDRSPLSEDYSVIPALLRQSPAGEMGQSLADACVLSPVRALPTALPRGGSRRPQRARQVRWNPYAGGTRMSVQRDAFRTTLRVASLCLELDCNTIFDSARYRECPTCGSAETYPLETWLNRYRLQALAVNYQEIVHPGRLCDGGG